MCGPLNAVVLEHHLEQLSQTLIVLLQITHLLHQPQIVKGYHDLIEFVTRPAWPQRILNMKLTLVTNALYLATETSVMKVPVERCSRYLSKEQCHKAMDPYCGWNSRQRACTTQPKSGSAELSHWSQPQLECPAQNLPVSIQQLDPKPLLSAFSPGSESKLKTLSDCATYLIRKETKTRFFLVQ